MTLVWLAPRVVTGACGRQVRRSLAGAVAVGALSACARPAVVGRITAAHPGATYEATARGCDLHRRVTNREFGADLWDAIVWSRQIVATAGYLPCDVLVEAVVGQRGEAVYRVARTADGQRHEGPVSPSAP